MIVTQLRKLIEPDQDGITPLAKHLSKEFNPDQPRDERGRFGSGSSGGESAHDVAVKAAADAKAAEPRITAVMKAAAAKAGGRLVGLRNATKGAGSLERKITTKVNEFAAKGLSLSPKEAVGKIHDTNRYTMVLSPEKYAAGVKSTVADLQNQGYKFPSNRWMNKWEPGNAYRGLNVTAIDPSGKSIEIQFHTQESFDTKTVNHKDYETERLETTPQDQKNILNDRMSARALQVMSPPGAEGLTEVPR